MSTPEPIGQQGRWLDLLAEYDITIQHRPGRVHGNSDALSRRPCERSDGTTCRQCRRPNSGAAESAEVTTSQHGSLESSAGMMAAQTGDIDNTVVKTAFPAANTSVSVHNTVPVLSTAPPVIDVTNISSVTNTVPSGFVVSSDSDSQIVPIVSNAETNIAQSVVFTPVVSDHAVQGFSVSVSTTPSVDISNTGSVEREFPVVWSADDELELVNNAASLVTIAAQSGYTAAPLTSIAAPLVSIAAQSGHTAAQFSNTAACVKMSPTGVAPTDKGRVGAAPDSNDSSVSITADDIRRAQGTDDCLQPVIQLLQSGNPVPTGFEFRRFPEESRILLVQWNSLLLQDGILYRRFQHSDGSTKFLQIILPAALRRQFVERLHSDIGHVGQVKSAMAFLRRAYFPGWRKYVKLSVRNCNVCNSRQRAHQTTRQAPLQPMTEFRPMSLLHADLIGPLPVGSNSRGQKGFQYILSVIDSATRFLWLIPLRRKTADAVAATLFDEIITKFSIPNALVTDQGKEFTNSVLQHLCRRLEIKHLRTSGYHPETDSKCERSHFSVHNMLSKLLTDNHSTWPDHLSPVAMAYNSTIHISTGYSPHELFFSYQPFCPLDVMTQTPPLQPADNADQYAFQAQTRLQNAFAFVREQTGRHAENMKRQYDMSVKPKVYETGDLVLLYTPKKRKGQYSKWCTYWHGPFTVVKALNSVNYVVQKTPRSRTFIVHVNRLKPYFAGMQNIQPSMLPPQLVEADSGNGGSDPQRTAVTANTDTNSDTSAAMQTDMYSSSVHTPAGHTSPVDRSNGVPMTTTRSRRRPQRPRRVDSPERPRPATPQTNVTRSPRPARVRRPPARYVNQLYVSRQSAIACSTCSRARACFDPSYDTCILTCDNFAAMPKRSGNRSRSARHRSPTPPAVRPPSTRRPHHDLVPRPGETEDDRRRRVTAARRQRHQSAPRFPPRRCRLCGPDSIPVYTTRSGMCQHAKHRHDCWYKPKGDIFVPIPPEALAAARARVAAGTARRRRDDPVRWPGDAPRRIRTIRVDEPQDNDRRRHRRRESPVAAHRSRRRERQTPTPPFRRPSPPAVLGRPPSVSSTSSGEHSMATEVSVSLTTALQDTDLQVIGTLDRTDDNILPLSPNLECLVDNLPTPVILASEDASTVDSTPPQLSLLTPILEPLTSVPPQQLLSTEPLPIATSTATTIQVMPPQPVPLSPLRMTDLITTVRTTSYDRVPQEVQRLRRHFSTDMTEDHLFTVLASMHMARRDVAYQLREHIVEARSQEVSDSDVVTTALLTIDAVTEEYFAM